MVDTATFGLTIPGADKFWSWDGFVIDCPRYLDRMLEQLSDDDNVKVKLGQPGFSSIKQVVEYAKGLDCIGVVNCIGRGAAEVCDDNSVTPARGALVHYNRPVRWFRLKYFQANHNKYRIVKCENGGHE